MSEVSELVAIEGSDKASSLSLITNDSYMDRVMSLAKMMAGSRVTVPKHLQGSEGDCAAIIIQATNWGMNPYAVAQKTHLVNGVLGYEAQLVNAVIQTSNSIKGTFSYEYQGDGAAMQCRVGAILRGQTKITWGEWLKSSDVTTKNSPLWKTNPKQQMGYLQVKNWARLYAPGAILGVYTADELESIVEKDVTPQPKVRPILADEAFNSNLAKWKGSIESGKHTIRSLTAWIEAKGADLSQEQKKEVSAWVIKPLETVIDNPSQNSFVAEYEESEAE